MRVSRRSILLSGLLLGTAAAAVPVRGGLSPDLQKKVDRYDPVIRRIAARYVVDPALVHSIIAAESDYNRFAVSDKGAQGLMQLMPGTAKDYGVENSFDIAQNIEGGIKYLKDLQKTYPGKPDLVLAAYNAGPKAVAKYDGVPPYAETRTYVARVRNYYRQLSPTRRTPIVEMVDKNGRLIVTNDPRLVYR
jgi:soluble lytic murein transglycosylase-like protein